MKRWIAAGGTAAVLAAGIALWAQTGGEASSNKDDVAIDFDRYEASSDEPTSEKGTETSQEKSAEQAEASPAETAPEQGDKKPKTAETDIQVLGVEQEDRTSDSQPSAPNQKSNESTLQQLNPKLRDNIARDTNLAGMESTHTIPRSLRQVNAGNFKPQNLPVPNENK